MTEEQAFDNLQAVPDGDDPKRGGIPVPEPDDTKLPKYDPTPAPGGPAPEKPAED